MIIQRELYAQVAPYLDSPEAIVITGMRRAGKTTLLRFIHDKIHSQNKLFLDLENPLNQKYFEQEDFEQIHYTLETLGIVFTKRAYIFLDEIQLVKRIPQVVKYLMDHYQAKFFLSGSASFYLKNLFSESLAGRKYVFELFPFSFIEFLELKRVKLQIPEHSKITQPIFETVSRYYNEYMEFGGFPQVIIKPSLTEKKAALNDIFSSYFQLEVKQLSDFRKLDKVRDLILLLMERIGTKVDIQKLSQELGISRETLYEYLAFLEGTYLIKLVKPFSTSRDVEIRKMAKVYACDSGLANAIANVSKGTLFEQTVFQSLRIRNQLHYYQRKGGAEIDFIVNRDRAYEVKTNPTHSDLRKLAKISCSIGFNIYAIISCNDSPLEHVCYGFEVH